MQGLAFANVLPRFVSRVNVLKRCACRLSGEGERLDLRAPLKTYFGLANFREGQEQVIEKLVNGKSAVAVFPTAGGKSLCYQLPAVMFDGLTVVVSPLLSLMRNQVDYLSGKQIPAAMVSSAQSPAEVDEIYEKLRNNEIKLLYCSPERFYDDRFLSALKKVQISMFAVDEAHCISEWGHSFRPLYTRVATMANMVGAERCLALTATATLPVISDIRNDFGIAAEDTVSLPFHRPNLQLKVSVIPGFSERLEYLYQVISERPRGSVIVYVMLQSTAEQVAQYLQERGIDAEFYHAGMNGQAREVLESRFQNDLHVIVATIAFGMGIDKADVRYVYHFNVAKSIEAYSQETGRAGRDGLPSICETFFDPDDVQRAKELINTNLEANRELEHSLEEVSDNALCGDHRGNSCDAQSP
uniref:DNA 3'-5' helicase n=1 Tax=Rhodosorus marinus TaxID=101924 RepID=A0A7S3EE84_9RHOD|mmetsp:Transcript_26834/g.104178  ORF Transcript_26834/g.104178 Transcript_26834/m.104178 type:complete len:414 (+) Transcript_26834:132-1373(+)